MSHGNCIADGKYSTLLNLKSSTVLITGGSSGIGFGLTKRFLQAGSTVIITGRREEQLKEAVQKLNGGNKLFYHVGDIGSAQYRQQLFNYIIKQHPQMNILVNNAGIMHNQSVSDLIESSSWEECEKEIQINLCGPIHLTALFIPHLKQQQQQSAIINITSGLAFIPSSRSPVYCATKAAIHSFTMSLRFELTNDESSSSSSKSIQVYEIVPPKIKTNLDLTSNMGEDLDEYCDHTFSHFINGKKEIGFKFSEKGRKSTRQEIDETFHNFNTTIKQHQQQQQQQQKSVKTNK